MARKKPLCAFLALCLSAADERLTARSRKEKGGPPDVKKYTLKRILTSLFTLLAILLVLFILMQLMPGSPFNDEKLTPDMRAALYAKYGLDQPIYIQFFRYVGNMLRGDLGVSYNISKNTPISQLIQSRLPISIQVGGMAVTLGAIAGLVLGILAALKRDTVVDSIATIISVIGVSVPSYVFALALSYTFGFKFRWFPMLFSAKDIFGSSVLPSISLSMFTMASIARFTRSEMIEVLDSDYMLLAVLGPGMNSYTYSGQDLSQKNFAPRVPGIEQFGILDGSEKMSTTTGTKVTNAYQEKDKLDVYYWFGSDLYGRDIWTRTWEGARVSLIIAVAAAIIDMVIGMSYGLISGYFGGRVDMVMQRFLEVANGIPRLVIVTLLLLVLQPGMVTIIFALMLTEWVGMSRIARAEMLKLKDQEFVLASRTLGAGSFFIIFKEVLPNIIGPIITQVMFLSLIHI